jgi:L-seryl-tRNA(Ser) seleniumtransferase
MSAHRQLPAVGRLVAALADCPRPLVVAEARSVVDAVRRGERPAPEDWTAAVRERVDARLRPILRRVINATGVVLHTNLGRAPLGDRARAHLAVVSEGWANLEIDLEAGERGERLHGVAGRLCRLTGAEAALAVNNNAAAVLLVLTALAKGREVVVSRGELVEIGGSFRVPDVIAAGGARLVEVGTTNRTRARDFRAALGPDTAAILRIHPSNFRVTGFTETPDPVELREIARAAGVPVLEDLGSGALVEGLGETTIAEALARADLVCFSGDKLLGGPQAGLVAGRADLVAAARKHPMYRALRLDRLVLAALEGTLAGDEAGEAPPAVSMLRAAPAELRRRADAFAAALEAEGWSPRVIPADGQAGGGSLPGVGLPGWAVALGGPDVDGLAARLRTGTPAVLGRVADGRLLLDLRTVPPGDEAPLRAALAAARGSWPG